MTQETVVFETAVGIVIRERTEKMCNKAKKYFCAVLLVIFGAVLWGPEHNNVTCAHLRWAGAGRPRVREVGIAPGVLSPGNLNGITDVEGVKVGHVTLIEGKDIRTGVTAIIPHSGNLFAEKVPAAIYLGNAFGKLIGYTQVEELGNIETPIVLTNTLNVGIVADGVIEYMLNLPGNENVMSINPVVGETNDGWLNNIRSRPVRQHHVREAIEKAAVGPVEEGSVGAGTGTICFGFKGGIGTSSRRLPKLQGGYTVGVLVQSNFGGVLTINGAPVGRELAVKKNSGNESGSCMIVVATDAPLLSRNLKRLAKRAVLGLARTGSVMDNFSGDYVIAFSTAKALRVGAKAREIADSGQRIADSNGSTGSPSRAESKESLNAKRYTLNAIDDMDDVVVINEVFEATVEDNLINPTFVIDYPAALCPLTKRKKDNPKFAERFELFIARMELANAYTELNDPAEQYENFRTQLRGQEESLTKMDRDYITALKYGMPPAGGLGIGIDRLVMVLTGAVSIRDVVLFPLLRPAKG